jgi:hypothetical protein
VDAAAAVAAPCENLHALPKRQLPAAKNMHGTVLVLDAAALPGDNAMMGGWRKLQFPRRSHLRPLARTHESHTTSVSRHCGAWRNAQSSRLQWPTRKKLQSTKDLIIVSSFKIDEWQNCGIAESE